MDYLAEGLSKLGIEVVIGAFAFEKSPPNSIRTLHLSRVRNILHSNKNVDIIHCHHTKMNYYSLMNSKPFLFHYHGASNAVQRMNLKASMLLCKNKISRIICVSSFALSQIMGIGGGPAMKIPSEIVRLGVDTQFYNSDLPRPYKTGDPELIFVGNLFKYKNILRILYEFPNILKSLSLIANVSLTQYIELISKRST